MSLTGLEITDAMQGLIAPQEESGVEMVVERFGIARYRWSQSVAIAANGAIRVPCGIAEQNMNVISAQYLTGDALTSNSSNYATLSLEQATSAGTTTAIGSSLTTPAGTGSWTARVPVDIDLTQASCYIPAGNQVVFRVAQAASGVIVPVGTFEVVCKYV